MVNQLFGMSNGPPQLPLLILGQTIQNGPYLMTVTNAMIAQRARENASLARRWEREQRRQARMLEAQDSYAGEFKEFKVRRRFLRRVFSLLTLQLLFTGLVVASFTFVEEPRNFMLMHPQMVMIASLGFLLAYCALSCSRCARSFPCNVVCLVLLTAALSYTTAAMAVFYSADSVLMATGATTFVTAFIFFTAACTKFDLTKYMGALMIFSLVMIVGMIGILIASRYTQIPSEHVFFAMLGTMSITMWMFFDVQTIMGGRSIEVSPDEVVFATTQIYVDIVLLFRYMLICMGNLNE